MWLPKPNSEYPKKENDSELNAMKIETITTIIIFISSVL